MNRANQYQLKNSSKHPLHWTLALVFILAALVILMTAYSDRVKASETDADAEHQEVAKGPHRGRLLVDGNFVLELAINEDGAVEDGAVEDGAVEGGVVEGGVVEGGVVEGGESPEYRAWATLDGKPLAPEIWQLEVQLRRLGGEVEYFNFVPQADFLRGQGIVGEPHSFDVTVTARYQQQQYHWAFPSYEGRLQLAPDLAREAGVVTALAEPGKLQQQIKVYGRLGIHPEAVRDLTARFPGVVRTVNVGLGAQVRAGDLLASVESNESLRTYSITAPMDGTLIVRNANPGEATGDKPLFRLANTRQVVANLALFPADVARVRLGQAVLLKTLQGTFSGQIEQLVPSSGEQGLVMAMVSLATPPAQWTPGEAISATITVDEFDAPLRVDNNALQDFRAWQVVFIQVGDTYEIRPLELGRSDGQFTEVLAGLKPGDSYVVNNSYLLKADLEKSGAAHDH